MGTYVYKVVPFEGKIKGSGSANEVSGQLQSLINGIASDGWELVTMADVGIEVSPGCLGGLLGKEKSYTRFDQLVFRRLNYRSERVVQEVQADRIVTTVRTLKSNYTRTVEYDGRWALVLSRLPTGASTTFAPALPYFNFPASPGATWQARVVETGTSGAQKIHEIRGNIGSWETVNVPAGSFSALKIVLADDISENGVVVQQGLDVSWYVPEVRRTVKTEESSFNPVSGERRQRTISLVEYLVR